MGGGSEGDSSGGVPQLRGASPVPGRGPGDRPIQIGEHHALSPCVVSCHLSLRCVDLLFTVYREAVHRSEVCRCAQDGERFCLGGGIQLGVRPNYAKAPAERL